MPTQFGDDKILYTKRDCYSDLSRGALDLQPALADMINLGKSMLILGSSGSSFTDVASSFGAGIGKTKWRLGRRTNAMKEMHHNAQILVKKFYDASKNNGKKLVMAKRR